MEIPLQISFRNMKTSTAVEEKIREETEKLSEFYHPIIGCRVVAEIPHEHLQTGLRFHIKIYLTVPGGEVVVNHEPTLHDSEKDLRIEKHRKKIEIAAPHKDIYVAIRDAFKSAKRLLEEFAREQRGEVKTHKIRQHGIISRIFQQDRFGYIETKAGDGIYFDSESISNNDFGFLKVGDEVSFFEELSDEGLIAVGVNSLTKKHKAGK